MENREQLLRNLKAVKAKLSKINQTRAKQVGIVAQFRQNEASIETGGIKGAASMVFVVVGVVMILLALLEQSMGMAAAMIVCLVVLFCTKGKKSKLKNVAIVFLVVFAAAFVWTTLEMIFEGNYVVLILTVIAVVIAVLGVRFVVKKENAAIAKRNEAVNEHNARLEFEYYATQGELDSQRKELAAMCQGWFPRDYCNEMAVNFFISAIENFKADNMKEAVNLFDDSEHKKKMLESQRRIEEQQRQQMIKQDTTNGLFLYANALNTADFILKWKK